MAIHPRRHLRRAQQLHNLQTGSAASAATEGVGAGAEARVPETLSGPYPYLSLPLPCTDLSLSPILSSSLTTTFSVRSDSTTLTNLSVNSGHGCKKDKEGGRAVAGGDLALGKSDSDGSSSSGGITHFLRTCFLAPSSPRCQSISCIEQQVSVVAFSGFDICFLVVVV